MSGCFGLLAAGPMFFVSGWVLMLFAGIEHEDIGVRPFGYGTALVVTVALWLALAPAISAIVRTSWKPVKVFWRK
jgi:uncharacterized ion transporter superfamily protein YfcC